MSRQNPPMVEQPNVVVIGNEEEGDDTHHCSVIQLTSNTLHDSNVIRFPDNPERKNKTAVKIKGNESIDEKNDSIVTFSKEEQATRAKRNKDKKPYWILVTYFVLCILLLISILSSPSLGISPKATFWFMITFGFVIAVGIFLYSNLENIVGTPLSLERKNSIRLSLPPVTDFCFFKKLTRVH